MLHREDGLGDAVGTGVSGEQGSEGGAMVPVSQWYSRQDPSGYQGGTSPAGRPCRIPGREELGLSGAGGRS